MATRMFHPLNGWTHAYDKGEVERLEKHGWAVEDLSIPGEQVAAVVAAVEAPQKKKPGPKPKH